MRHITKKSIRKKENRLILFEITIFIIFSFSILFGLINNSNGASLITGNAILNTAVTIEPNLSYNNNNQDSPPLIDKTENLVVEEDSNTPPPSSTTILSNESSGLSVQATSIDSCQTISSPGDYILTNSTIVDYPATCITINSDNVTFDCQNNIIDGIGTSTTYGFLLDHVQNVTVQNCNVNNFQHNFYVTFGTYSYFYNLTSTNATSYSLYFNQADNNLLDNYVSENNPYGFFLSYSDYNFFSNFSLMNSSNWALYTNKGAYNNFTTGLINGSNYALYLNYNTNYNRFSNINFTDNTNALYFSQATSNNNYIYNNYFANNTQTFYALTNYPVNYFYDTYSCGGETNIIGGSCKGGNYWDDFVAIDDDNDGIFDVGYQTPLGADYYPLSDGTNYSNLTTCGIFPNPGDYFLAGNISDSLFTCMNFVSDNVTLDCQDNIVDGIGTTSSSGFLLDHVQNVTVQNCNVNNFYRNFYLTFGTYSYLYNLTSTNATNYGLYFNQADNNRLDNYVSENNPSGFYFTYSDSNFFSNFSLINSSNWGIYTNKGTYNNFTTGLINGSNYALYLSYNTNNNRFSGINFTDNTNALYFSQSTSSSNYLYNNYFANNTNNFYTPTNYPVNYFYDTYSCGGETNIVGGSCKGGNYWDDFVAMDDDNDGIFDVGYQTPLGADYYPLSDGINYSNLTTCGVFPNPGDYFLSGNISDSGSTCMNFVSDNVTLDCQDNIVDGIGTNDGFLLDHVQNVTVQNCNVNNFNRNFYLTYGTYSYLYNLTSTNATNYGLNFNQADNNRLDNYISENNPYGFYLIFSDYNFFSNFSLINSTTRGINLGSSTYNNFTSGLIKDSSYGIYTYNNNKYNRFSNLNITNNTDYGIYLGYSTDDYNYFYNNFLNNTINAYYVSGVTSYWNTAYSATTNILGLTGYGGNAWILPNGTGYSENCDDVDANGICDSPYSVGVGEDDNYPLTLKAVPEVTMNTPLNNSLVSTSVAILNVTIHDANGDVMTVWFYGDGSLINTTTATNGEVTYNWTGLSDGSYNWTVIANDGSANSTNEYYYFDLDNNTPLISYTGNSDSSGNKSQTNIFINVSLSEQFLDTIYLYFNGTAESFQSNDGTNYWSNKTSLSNGNYTFYVLVNDTSGRTNQTEIINITLDTTAPSISSISYDPNNDLNIDPGTLLSFNTTITDSATGVDTVIFQYDNSSSWNNLTMNLLGNNIYNVSFSTSGSELNYTFNIWANDSSGNIQQSSNQYINSSWDCAWNTTPTNLGETAGWNENKNLGNLTIYNLGDIEYANSNCSLDFRFTYDLTQGRIYIGDDYIKPSSTYSVTVGNNFTVKVNSTFLTETAEETATIIVDEIRSRSNESQQNVTATIISTTGGPYLYESISSAPTSIYLTPNSFNLTSYIRNMVGDGTINNTAYNVSFNWSLPNGFTINSGNATISYDNISNNSQVANSLEIIFDSDNLVDLSPGLSTIYLFAEGYNYSGGKIVHSGNRTLLNESATINLLCYDTADSIIVTNCGSLDGDYVESTTTVTQTVSGGSSGGGSAVGGGGGLSSEQLSTLFQTEETYELVRGENNSFILTIENPFESDLTNLGIQVSGFIGQYLRLSKNQLGTIKEGESKNVEVFIEAPEYFSPGIYDLTFLITGTYKKYVNIDMEETRNVKLYVHDVSRNESKYYLNSISEIIVSMSSQEFNVDELEKIYSESQIKFNNNDYESVKVNYELVKLKNDQAVKSNILFKEIEKLLKKAKRNGVKTPETEKLLFLAKSAFNRGDYETSLKRVEEAKTTFALETVGKINIFAFTKNNWPEITFSLLGLSIFSSFSYMLIRRNLVNRHLESLRREEQILLGLIKEIQKECFEERKMSMKEYLTSLMSYENKLSKVIQNIIQFENLKAHTLNMFKSKHFLLDKERERIVDLIKDTQKKYLKKGVIETHIYESRMRSYTSRLSEIEEALAVVTAKEEMRKIKRIS